MASGLDNLQGQVEQLLAYRTPYRLQGIDF